MPVSSAPLPRKYAAVALPLSVAPLPENVPAACTLFPDRFHTLTLFP